MVAILGGQGFKAATLPYANEGVVGTAEGGRLGYDRVSSKNSKANRIETGEGSGGIRRNLFGGSRRKIAKKIADHRPS